MNQQLSNIELLIQQSSLPDEEKQKLLKEISAADKQLNILEFKLDRTEKVKKTTAVLLEETIEELENKRKAVEAQNHELEIEAALERVRAVALGMKEPSDMLEICSTISQQLHLLNVKEIRNVQTAIFYESKGTYMNYEYYAKHNKTFITETSFTNHAMHKAFAAQMLKGKGGFFTRYIDKDELPDWIAYQKTTNVFIDTFLETATSLSYYWFSLGPLALGISTYEPLKDEEQNLFKRFLKVFELSYTRYLDIEQAIAQTRESQIQLALERVRARTMAMQKSDELSDTAFILFQQFRQLGENPVQITIGIFNEEKKVIEFHVTGLDGDGSKVDESRNMDLNEPFLLNKLFIAWKEQSKSIIIKLAGDELVGWMKYRQSVAGDLGNSADFSSDQERFLGAAFFSKGLISFSKEKSISDETMQILKRFAQVFEQTYTRFLDLQKAEAQTRESQIQLALERVRARTMAMQKSDELSEAVYILFQQFKELGQNPDQATIGVINENENVIEYWVTMYGNQMNKVFKFSIDEPNVTNKIYKAWKENKRSLLIDLRGKELYEFANYRESMGGAKYNPGEKRRVINVAFFNKGLLNVQSNEEQSEESIKLLERFASVFDQTYTRFLDLQKAEAQTRESEIELGLERVRSRAMAMQTSEELNALIGTVFTELTRLDLVLTRCVILIYEGNEKGVRWWMANSETPSTPMNFFVKYADMPFFNEYLKGWYNRELKWQYCLEDENKIKTDAFLFNETELSLLPGFVIEGMKAPDHVYLNASFNNFGNLTLATLEPLSDEHFNILLRFAKVFDLTYTRFNDLKQAEAQAREAQIEAALERVRSKSIGMQKSEELKEVIQVVYDQFVHLKINVDHAGFVVDYIAKGDWHFWIADKNDIPSQITVPYFESVWGIQFHESKERGINFFATHLNFEEKNKFYQVLLNLVPGLPDEAKEFYFTCPGLAASTALTDNVSLYIENFSGIPYTDEENKILGRFGKAFQQTYTRFLDLQKAEAQAREAQIQLALERVRARTMAMQQQNDLLGVLDLLVQQLIKLGVHFEIANFSNGIPGADWDLWIDVVTENGELYSNYVHFPRIDHPYFNRVEKNIEVFRNGGGDLFKDVFSKDEKDSWQDYICTQTIYKDIVTQEDKEYIYGKPGYTWSLVLLKDTWVSICRFDNVPFSNEEDALFRRFANAFGQAYTRFLDLQKAEAQAREAQIEAALEKVRSRSLAMNKSEDLKDVVSVVLEQLQHLGFAMDGGAVHIGMFNDAAKEYIQWSADPLVQTVASYKIPYNDNPMFTDLQKAKENGEDTFSHKYSFEEKNKWFDWAFEHSDFKCLPAEFKKILLECESYSHWAAFQKNSAIIVNNILDKFLSQEQIDILRRFVKVFEQSYIRFLDLQKAEAQAREAQIEASLERVRAKAMAMQNSNDLSATASLVFTELRKLGIAPIRCGFGSLSKESHQAQLYSATSSENGDSLSLIGWVQLENHPVLEKIYDSWLQQHDYFPELQGDQLQSYYQLLLAGLSVPVPDFSNEQKQFGHFFQFSVGCLYAWSDKHYKDDQIKILKRFATIIDLTFRRYLELQTSEANAKEAIKQAALDRIRADIASMRTISDLDRITPLIWNELTILGIPFIRCGVFIMDEEQQLIHTFLSTPDGNAIAAFHIPYDTPGNIMHVLTHWRDDKNYIDHWDEDAFTQFAETLVRQDALTSAKQYLQTMPHGGFYLHFLPFLQGMLYVGNTTQLSEEEISLIQSIADAFSTAYARYEDFNKLEAAKQQVEKTLSDLKQTQQQLLQAEKMASLGELTAGIAHEIQNPLNFVNNFSEVSNELISEMVDEVDKGNTEDVKLIAADIKQNLEKINHHGKRADAIVKGMLQHSRQSSGKKEPTDINALCDEYLRLSYHGLRAKDKSFNADFKTDFDESVGKINIVPQDIGRVLLNLINNAFYAVNEKKKLLANGYQPIAEVKTRRISNKVEISVRDNGNGIPQNIIDKIFQPFFTTKPTGQGTGLGLSLAYDIITKEHNGTIKVESKEGEGSSFIINLPV